MNVSEEIKVADIVADNIQAAHVFKKYGIDFCCGGGISVAKACKKHNVNSSILLQEINNLDTSVLPSQNFNNWDLGFLIDYIINTHHKYVSEAILLIEAYASKVAKVHGHAHPQVLEIHSKFQLVKEELISHMYKEEKILFPFIKSMVSANFERGKIDVPVFGTVNNPISMMVHEHEFVGGLLKEISILSNAYTPPEWACNTFRALYAKLNEFEQDLHIHIHLENNILFPKAIHLESLELVS